MLFISLFMKKKNLIQRSWCQLGSRQPMSPGADGVDGMRDDADGDSCFAETLKDPTSPAFSYHPDNQLGLLDTPDLCFNLDGLFCNNSFFPIKSSY